MADNTKFANTSDLELSKDNDASEIDSKDRVIGQIQKILRDWREIKEIKEQENDLIDDRLDEVTSVQNRSVNSAMPPHLMLVAKRNLLRMLQPPDFMLESDGVSKEEAGFTTDGVVDVMKDGNWQHVLKGKRGAFDKMGTYGDSFIQGASFKQDFGESGKKKGIMTYINRPFSRNYFDVFATNIRNPGGEGDANEHVGTALYNWEDAIKLYPEIKESAKPGLLPGTFDDEDDLKTYNSIQQSFIDQNKIEIGYYNNKRDRIYAIVAGSNMFKLREFRDSKYPFVFKDTDESYINIIHLQFMSKVKGLYGIGICGLFYPLDLIWQELMNRGNVYILENVDPIKMINLPPDKRSEFYTMLSDAQDAQEQGERPIIVNELDSALGANLGQLQTMSTPALTQEFERLINQIRLIAGMLGIKLDQLLSTPGKPLGTTELELENQTEVARDIIDYNTTEWEFAVRLAMDAIRRDVKDEDDTPVTSVRKVKLTDPETGEAIRDENGIPREFNPFEGQDEDGNDRNFTLGMVAQSLRKHKYRVVVNTKSGAVKNNALRRAQIIRLLNSEINPQNPFAEKLRTELATIEGFTRDSVEGFNPQAPAAPGGGGQQNLEAPIPTGLSTPGALPL